jgi:hypothetical protein
MRCGLATAPRKTGLPRASIRKPADETKQADERDHYTLLLIYKTLFLLNENLAFIK